MDPRPGPCRCRCPRALAPRRAASVAGLVAGLAASLFAASRARAEVDFKYGFTVASDVRYRIGGEYQDPTYPSQLVLLKDGFSRNENLIKSQLSLGIAGKVKAVTDIDLYLYGFSDVHDFDALTLHERVDPYRLEVNSAYLDVYRILPGLDLRIGRQVVVWGTADKFNPTSNVSTLDLSDPLLFGKALGNNMLRADFNPIGDWVLTGVFVPIFRPAELPRTAVVALQQLDRPIPVQDNAARATIDALGQIIPPTQINVSTLQPDPSIANSQFAFRLGGRVLGQDVSASFYHGRFGIPVPAYSTNRADRQADVAVVWPTENVIGGDIGGSIPALAGMGYWAEAAAVIPDEIRYTLYNDMGNGHFEERFTAQGAIAPVSVDKTGNYTGPIPTNATKPIVIPNTPYPKVTIGADMSLGAHVYINMQYVHGFIDEFGAGVQPRPGQNYLLSSTDERLEQRIGDYLVAGADVKMLGDTLLFRFFGVLKVPSMDPANNFRFDDYLPTGVLFPQLAYQVWDGTEISVGGFIFLGDRTTKFGDPAAGASELFAKAKFQY